MEIRIEAIRTVDTQSLANIDKVRHNFDRIYEVFSLLNPENSKSLESLTNFQDDIISGVPGTQSDTYHQFSEYLTEILTEFNTVNDKAKKSFDVLSAKLDSDKKRFNVEDMMSHARQMKNLKLMSSLKMQESSKTSQKALKQVNDIMTSRSKRGIEKKAIKKLRSIEKLRCATEYRKEIAVAAAQKCMNEIVTNAAVIQKRVKKRCLRQREILTLIKKYYLRYTEILKNFSNSISEGSQKIDFLKDFVPYINRAHIIRYDILPEPFEPIDLNHEVFSGMQVVKSIASPQLYPIAMARVVCSFTAEAANEISVRIGKTIFLMEELDYPWVLVQNPFTRTMGFCPSSFCEYIGKGIGVILNEHAAGKVALQKGDYVAIDTKGESLTCVVTVTDESVYIPNELIGIISESK